MSTLAGWFLLQSDSKGGPARMFVPHIKKHPILESEVSLWLLGNIVYFLSGLFFQTLFFHRVSFIFCGYAAGLPPHQQIAPFVLQSTKDHWDLSFPEKQNFVANHHWVIFTIFAKNSSQIIIGSIFPPRVKKNTNNCKYLNAFCVSFEFVFLLLFVIMTTLIISSVLVVVVIYWLLHRDP